MRRNALVRKHAPGASNLSARSWWSRECLGWGESGIGVNLVQKSGFVRSHWGKLYPLLADVALTSRVAQHAVQLAAASAVLSRNNLVVIFAFVCNCSV
jgi:hypothetical protein